MIVVNFFIGMVCLLELFKRWINVCIIGYVLMVFWIVFGVYLVYFLVINVVSLFF